MNIRTGDPNEDVYSIVAPISNRQYCELIKIEIVEKFKNAISDESGVYLSK